MVSLNGIWRHELFKVYNTWQLPQKKLLLLVLPVWDLVKGMLHRGHIFLVCANQCFLNVNSFFHRRKSNAYWRTSRISSFNLDSGNAPNTDKGWTLIRNSTSFFIMFPLPANISWSSKASQENTLGIFLTFSMHLQRSNSPP